MQRELADLLTTDDHACRAPLVPTSTIRGTMLRCIDCNALLARAEVHPA